MKTKQTLAFSIIPKPIEFSLDIIELQPATDFGTGWKFVENEINGLADNDGITAFKTSIIKAATLPKEVGYKLLFATGISKNKTSITGEDRIKILSDLNLADPDLLWSLYKEEDQKTLRYLHDTYGVTRMEALRRIFLGPDGRRYSLSLNRSPDGSWRCNYSWLDSVRGADDHALSLAS